MIDILNENNPKLQYLGLFYALKKDNFRCSNDYVAIYDGRDKNAQLIGRYCGILRPPPIISSQRSLFVEFYSDSSIQSQGFLANIGTTSLGPASLSSGDVCGGYIVSRLN